MNYKTDFDNYLEEEKASDEIPISITKFIIISFLLIIATVFGLIFFFSSSRDEDTGMQELSTIEEVNENQEYPVNGYASAESENNFENNFTVPNEYPSVIGITEEDFQEVIEVVEIFLYKAGSFGFDWSLIDRMSRAMQFNDISENIKEEALKNRSREVVYRETVSLLATSSPLQLTSSEIRNISDWWEDNSAANYTIQNINIEHKEFITEDEIKVTVTFDSTLKFINTFVISQDIIWDDVKEFLEGWSEEDVANYIEHYGVIMEPNDYSQVSIDEIIFTNNFSEQMEIILLKQDGNWMIYDINHQTYPFLLAVWNTVNSHEFSNRFYLDFS